MPPRAGVDEMLSEFQSYVMAYRLRRAIGDRVAPPGPQLTLAQYARKRLRRQELARQLVGKGIGHGGMGELDDLTDELMFGFWYNPLRVSDFLTAVLRSCPHPAIGDPLAFQALLTPTEAARLGRDGVGRVVGHYLLCLTLASPLVAPVTLGRIWEKIDASTPPLFVDEVVGERPAEEP